MMFGRYADKLHFKLISTNVFDDEKATNRVESFQKFETVDGP